MNDEKARERMRNLTVDMLQKIMTQAEMLENVTGMKPTVFMSRGMARLFAGGLMGGISENQFEERR
jgi:hypothetical protein